MANKIKKLAKAIEAALTKVNDGDELICTIIYKGGETETVTDVHIALTTKKDGTTGEYDEVKDGDGTAFWYCGDKDGFRKLLDDTSDAPFVVAAFAKNGTVLWTCHKVYHCKSADGWHLTLRGFSVGGRWEYTAESPMGKHFETGNEWVWEDSDGEPCERPIVPSLDELLIDATNCLEGDCCECDCPDGYDFHKI